MTGLTADSDVWIRRFHPPAAGEPERTPLVCFPHAGRLVPKQTRTPPMVAARPGEWQVLPDTSGVLVVCRQTLLIRAEEIEPVLGPGAGPDGRHRARVAHLTGPRGPPRPRWCPP